MRRPPRSGTFLAGGLLLLVVGIGLLTIVFVGNRQNNNNLAPAKSVKGGKPTDNVVSQSVPDSSHDIAVIGMGYGGAHTAMRLAQNITTKTFLFVERETAAGGRLLDAINTACLAQPGKTAADCKIPTGGMRIITLYGEGRDTFQSRQFNLGAEFNIEYEEVPRDTNWYASGLYSGFTTELFDPNPNYGSINRYGGYPNMAFRAGYSCQKPGKGYPPTLMRGQMGWNQRPACKATKDGLWSYFDFTGYDVESAATEWMFYGGDPINFDDDREAYIPTNVTWIPYGYKPYLDHRPAESIRVWQTRVFNTGADSWGLTNAGEETYAALTAVFSFCDSHWPQIAAQPYLDWFRLDWDRFGTRFHPIGGMQQFAVEMLAAAQSAAGAHHTTLMAVELLEINVSPQMGYRYRLSFSDLTERDVNEVILAIPPQAVQRLGGTIGSQLAQNDHITGLFGVPVVTISVVFDNAWWMTTDFDPPKNATGVYITRKPHRVSSKATCLTISEYPREEWSYLLDQKAARLVYSDDPLCIEYWQAVRAKGDDNLIKEAILEMLRHAWPGNTVQLSDMGQVIYKYWPDAWYFGRTGTTYTVDDTLAYSLQPLPNEAIYLTGTAYDPREETWADGALSHSLRLLCKAYALPYDIYTGQFLDVSDPSVDCDALACNPADSVNPAAFGVCWP